MASMRTTTHVQRHAHNNTCSTACARQHMCNGMRTTAHVQRHAHNNTCLAWAYSNGMPTTTHVLRGRTATARAQQRMCNGMRTTAHVLRGRTATARTQQHLCDGMRTTTHVTCMDVQQWHAHNTTCVLRGRTRLGGTQHAGVGDGLITRTTTHVQRRVHSNTTAGLHTWCTATQRHVHNNTTARAQQHDCRLARMVHSNMCIYWCVLVAQRVAGADAAEGGALETVLPTVANIIRHGVGLNTKV